GGRRRVTRGKPCFPVDPLLLRAGTTACPRLSAGRSPPSAAWVSARTAARWPSSWPTHGSPTGMRLVLRSFSVVETLNRNRLPALAALAGTLVAVAIAMIFFYAPVDQDGLNQKIFYFHVPVALTAYAGFGWGAWKALLHLWKGKPGADLESYVA